MSNSGTPERKIRRLSDIVREARIAAAERQDSVENVREADRARLELLAEEIDPIFDEVPEGDDQFDFYLSSGEQPRLWIDAIAHVHMGNDQRTYRFVRDTRHGRVMIAEDADMMSVADSVARYVAERIVERQRFLESEPMNVNRPTFAKRARSRETGNEPVGSANSDGQPGPMQPTHTKAPPGPFGVVSALIWFFLGMVVAGAVLAAAFWDAIAPKLTML